MCLPGGTGRPITDGGNTETDAEWVSEMETVLGESVRQTATNACELALELEYTAHVVVLKAVAVLEVCGVDHATIGDVQTIVKRITESDRSRRSVEHSLTILDERDFVDREKVNTAGGAYHWSLADRGRDFFTATGSMRLVRALAETSVVDGFEACNDDQNKDQSNG